jgi:hypothetical protein
MPHGHTTARRGLRRSGQPLPELTLPSSDNQIISAVFQGRVITAGFGKLSNFALGVKNRLQGDVQRSSHRCLNAL